MAWDWVKPLAKPRSDHYLSLMFSSWKLLWILLLFIPCLWMGIRYDVDFIVLYDTARLVVNQELSRIYSNLGVNGSIGRYFYGPFSLVVIFPFGLVSYGVAKGIWLALQTLAYFYFWRRLGKIFPWMDEKAITIPWVLVWLVAINPLHNNFQSNNIQLFLAVMIMAAEQVPGEKYDFKRLIVGLPIAIGAAIKIFPFFLFAFYWLTHDRKVKTELLLALAITIIAPFLVFGWSDGVFLHQAFFTNLTSYGNENSLLTVEDICCLPSLVARWLNALPVPISEKGSGLVIKLLIVGISAVFLGFTWLKRKRLRESRDAYLSMWTLALALMAFLNPSSRPHYYIFYVPAFAYLGKQWRENLLSKGQKAWLIASVILIAFSQEGVTGKAWNDWLEIRSIPTYGMLILCVLSTQLAWKKTKAA